MKSKIFKSLNNKTVLFMLILLIVSVVTQGAITGLDIVDYLENGLGLSQTVTFYVMGIGAIIFIVNMFLGNRSTTVGVLGVGLMLGGYVVANIDKVITFLSKLTAGACF